MMGTVKGSDGALVGNENRDKSSDVAFMGDGKRVYGSDGSFLVMGRPFLAHLHVA